MIDTVMELDKDVPACLPQPYAVGAMEEACNENFPLYYY